MQRQPQKKHRGLLLLIAGLSVAMVFLLSIRAQTEIAAIESRALKADITKPMRSARRLQVKQLDDEINKLIDAEPGATIGVALHDFVLDRTFTYGAADEAFVAASVPKLLTAGLWLHEVDEGRRSLDEPVGGSTAREQLRLLIEISDNAAWELLDKELGKSALENYARELGMKHYDFDTNAMAPTDVLILLQKLYKGELLKEDSQKLLLGHMEKANYTQYIMSVLPDSAKGYHKIGFLEDRLLDVALVENKNLTYALVIFTEARGGGFSLASAGGLVRDITEAVQSRYEK